MENLNSRSVVLPVRAALVLLLKLNELCYKLVIKFTKKQNLQKQIVIPHSDAESVTSWHNVKQEFQFKNGAKNQTDSASGRGMTVDLSVLFFLKKPFNLYLTLALLLTFFGCRKERTSIPLEALTTPTTATLYDITFTHVDTGYAIGGTHWQHGEWLITTNGGDTWRTDTFANNGLLDIEFLGAETAIAVGFDGQAFYKPNANTWWAGYYPPEGETMNAVDFWDENTGVVVGGKNFAYGLIYRLNNINGTADTVYYPLTHELRDVQFTDKNTVHTVGYGYVGKSTDGGLTWQASDIQGDFFYALYFVNQELGYAVGRSGTIIKTTNGGGTWQKIRNGNSVFVSNEKFRDVWFKNENEGYIVGDDGLFWWTDDGGDSWKIVEDTPDVTFHRIFYQNGTGFIVGEEGKIYRFVD